MIEFDATGKTPEERERHREFTVRRIVKAPGFDMVRFTNDLAILELEKSIDLASSAGVSAACYPSCDGMFDFEFKNGTGSRCWVAGWGKDGITGNFKTTMHKVDVPIVENGRCENSLKDAIRSQGQTQFANSLRLHRYATYPPTLPGRGRERHNPVTRF